MRDKLLLPIKSKSLPSMENCIKGRVYKLKCRNLSLGVWNGRDGFIGIRTKFHDRYLFTEYHYDTGRHGTVIDAEDTGVNIPEDIPIRERFNTIDLDTCRPVAFDKPISEGGKGWYFTDTGESNQDIKAFSPSNEELFEFLDSL
jgi:hypothetical protein